MRDDQSIQETKREPGEVGRLKDGTCGYVEESTTGEGMVEDMVGETHDYKEEGGSGL